MPKTAPTLFPLPPFPPFPPGGRWTVLRESHGPASLSRPRPASDASLPCRNESTGPPTAAAAGSKILKVRWQLNQSLGLSLLKWEVNQSQVRVVSGTRQRQVGALCFVLNSTGVIMRLWPINKHTTHMLCGQGFLHMYLCILVPK